MASWVNLMDIIYPTGSIYLSMNSTSPASTIGGNWEQIVDQFLLPSNSSGTSGGSGDHNHTFGIYWAGYYTNFATMQNSLGDKGLITFDEEVSVTSYRSEWAHNRNGALNTVTASVDNPTVIYKSVKVTDESSMPPYITVYAWRRIS